MILRSTHVLCLAALLAVVSACGGSSPAAPTPTPTPAPTPAPTPTPNPEPTPTPTPTPEDCVNGLCEAPTTNTNPVSNAVLRLYTVQDQFYEWMNGWPASKPSPVGYHLKLDLTGKDEYSVKYLKYTRANVAAAKAAAASAAAPQETTETMQ